MEEECLSYYLLGIEEDIFQTDCESIWVKIIFAGKQRFHSMYRPAGES